MELAVTVDAMEHFVKATYYLGDGALAFYAYEHLSLLFSSVSNPHYPNVVSVAKDLANGSSSHVQQLVAYARSSVEPAYAESLRMTSRLFWMLLKQLATFLPQK